MNKSELQGFRKILKNNRAELSDGRRHREAIMIETSGDELDRIQHAQERDFAVGALNRESLRLGEVETALEVSTAATLVFVSTAKRKSMPSDSPRCRGPLAASPAKKLRIAWPATLRMWTSIRS